MSTALIPHPELSVLELLPPQPEITDERIALRLAAGYDDGAYMAIQRIALALSIGADYMRLDRELHRRFAPRYTELRDYLIHENNVAPLLAARIALRITRFVEVRP